MRNLPFTTQVYELLKTVPRGKVTTYKQIAEKLGTKAYRAVGTALNKNPAAPKVPCHRVINANGQLGGYVFGIEKKKELLRSEGVEVIKDKIKLDVYLHQFT